MPGSPSPGGTTGPGSSTSGTSVRLAWTAVAGAAEYDLGVRDMDANALVEDRRVPGTSFTASLQPDHRYRWNVRACNAAGCSAFTTPLYFRTPSAAPPPPRPPAPPAVTLPGVPEDPNPGAASGPGPNTSGISVRLDWDSVSGAAEYDLGVRDMTTNQLVVDRRVDGSAYTARLEPGRS